MSQIPTTGTAQQMPTTAGTTGTGPNYGAMLQDGQRGIQTGNYQQMAKDEYRDYTGNALPGTGTGTAAPASGGIGGAIHNVLGGQGAGTNIGGQPLGGTGATQPGGVGGGQQGGVKGAIDSVKNVFKH